MNSYERRDRDGTPGLVQNPVTRVVCEFRAGQVLVVFHGVLWQRLQKTKSHEEHAKKKNHIIKSNTHLIYWYFVRRVMYPTMPPGISRSKNSRQNSYYR